MIRCMEHCLKDFHDYKALFLIWNIASQFRAYPGAQWTENKCIEALSEIADLANRLVAECLPQQFCGLRPDQIFADMEASFVREAQDIRDRYSPYEN